MKQRLLSALIALIIFIPIFIIGGITFNIAFYILTLLGFKEFLDIRSKEKKFPDFIRLIGYIIISLLYFGTIVTEDLSFNISYKLIAGSFLVLLLPVVLYHDEKVYNVKDAFYILGGVLFLGFSMSLFSIYRNVSFELIVFLFLITIITDTYAYFIGRLIGKNKLLEEISPNKTWEGTIGGSAVSTFVCTVFYLTVINPDISIYEISIIVLFLSLVGQFGDLFFSAIKRKFKVKDFSNIMPGHGGILDRLDSIIFVLLTFTFFFNLL